MANTDRNHQDASDVGSTSSSAPHANGAVAPDGPLLKHNPGFSPVWTAEEQAILDDGLVKYESLSSIVKYAKIAEQMNDKTVRDVALRHRWMTFSSRPNVRPDASPSLLVDNDDGISCKAIDGPIREPLAQNVQAFDQISTNLSAFKIQDNISLFCQTRDNILKIMNDITDDSEIVKQMPPLPVKMNEELANIILPQTSWTKQP